MSDIEEIFVTKRDGSPEKYDHEKIMKQVRMACKGIADVDPKVIDKALKLELYDGMSTDHIDHTLIRVIRDMITTETNYQYVAGRIANSVLRKKVYGSFTPWNLQAILVQAVRDGMLSGELLQWYDSDELDYLDARIHYEREEEKTLAQVEQAQSKYLIRNKRTGKIYDTIEARYMVSAMTACNADGTGKERLNRVVDTYNFMSLGGYSTASPLVAGLGTSTKQFSSCVKITVPDTLKGIFEAGKAMADYASKRAGIGFEAGRIRSTGADIRNGEIAHTGLIPFIKKWFGDLRSCCLTPDMWVDTTQGPKQMKELRPGMQILTWDYNNSVIVFKEISDVFETTVPHEDQRVVHFSNGVKIHCSNNHPIMADDRREVKPDSIKASDKFIGTEGTVTCTDVLDDNRATTYIDITVEGTHTFFTSSERMGQRVLTHNSQGGIRNASATFSFPIWHYDVQDLIVLKNNRGTDENRERRLDYAFNINNYIFRRFVEQKDITLFCPHSAAGLYDLYYSDEEAFAKLYEQYEGNALIRKKTVSAEELFNLWVNNRTETNRIYGGYVSNWANGPINVKMRPIVQSNLCVSGDTKITIRQNGVVKTIDIDQIDMSSPVEVLSYDIDNGEQVFSKILAFAKTGTDSEVLKITDEGTGKFVICTPDHQIYTTSRGWVKASDLIESDTLVIE